MPENALQNHAPKCEKWRPVSPSEYLVRKFPDFTSGVKEWESLVVIQKECFVCCATNKSGPQKGRSNRNFLLQPHLTDANFYNLCPGSIFVRAEKVGEMRKMVHFGVKILESLIMSVGRCRIGRFLHNHYRFVTVVNHLGEINARIRLSEIFSVYFSQNVFYLALKNQRVNISTAMEENMCEISASPTNFKICFRFLSKQVFFSVKCGPPMHNFANSSIHAILVSIRPLNLVCPSRRPGSPRRGRRVRRTCHPHSTTPTPAWVPGVEPRMGHRT